MLLTCRCPGHRILQYCLDPVYLHKLFLATLRPLFSCVCRHAQARLYSLRSSLTATCLRFGATVRSKADFRICLDSPEQKIALEIQTTSPPPNSSSLVSTCYIHPRSIHDSRVHSPREGRRTYRTHLYFPLRYQACRPLWRPRVTCSISCWPSYLRLLIC